MPTRAFLGEKPELRLIVGGSSLSTEVLYQVGGFILSGAVVAIKVYIATILFSIPLGVLCAMGKLSNCKPLLWILEGYTWLFRGTPLLLQLFFVYFGLPYYGIVFSPFVAACVTFIINYAAYFTEIFRAGIQSIDYGQYEAAKALGMNYNQTMRRIILPQALKRVVPPMGNEAVTLIKDTALCSAITLPEILKNTNSMVTTYFEIRWYFFAAVIYLFITLGIIQLFKYLEKKFSYYR